MNGQQLAPICAGFAVAVVLFLVIGYFLRKRNMTAHLAPVKRELKKEKQWLRRGEYNAAMVKGRQNLELFLKLVAEFNGIELDNSAQAMANAKSGPDGRGQRETYRMNGRKRQRVMTFQQFGWWLDENGYLDRVGKWELNEIRVIGNKAVHENYDSKEDAWNQYNYMEDLLKIVSDRHTNRHRQRGPEIKKSQTGHRGAGVKKPSGTQAKARGQQNQKRGQNRPQGQPGNGSQRQPGNSGQSQPQKSDGGNKSGAQKDQNVQPEKLSASAKRRQRRKRAKAAREVAEAAGLKRETAPQEKAEKQAGSRPARAEEKAAKQPGSRPAQPSTSMRIVTLSQTTGGRTAAKPMSQREDPARQPKQKEAGKQPAKRPERKEAEKQTARQPKRKEAEKQTAKQPKNEETGKQTAGRRRKPRKRPASENAGKTAGRSAAGGGDHEE